MVQTLELIGHSSHEKERIQLISHNVTNNSLTAVKAEMHNTFRYQDPDRTFCTDRKRAHRLGFWQQLGSYQARARRTRLLAAFHSPYPVAASPSGCVTI